MKTAKKIWMGIGGLIAFSLAALVLFLPSHKALAASNIYVTSQKQIEDGIATLHFVNRFEIDGTFNGQNIKFIDSDPSDTTFNYKPTDGFCSSGHTVDGINIDSSQLDFQNLGNYITIPASVDLDYASAPTAGAKCSDTNPNKITTLNGSEVDIGSPDNASVMFTWNPDGTISRSDGASGWSFTAIASGSTIYRSDSNQCAKALVIRSGNQSGTVYDLTQSANGVYPDASTFSDLSGIFSSGTCYVKSVNLSKDPSKFQGLSQDAFTLAGTPPNDAGTCTSDCTPNQGGGGGGAGGSVGNGGACNAGSGCINGVCNTSKGDCENDSCAQLSASPFSWFLCPTLDIAEKGSNFLLRIFESQLSFTISDLNGSANCQTQAANSTCSDCQNKTNNDANACQEKVKRAWSVIRDISSAIMVIALLIMVISQAVSWGPFDAYTIKKMLPRIIVAVILIQISWDLFAWVIDLVNGIAKGLADLMYYPFGGSANLDLGSLLANANIGNTTGSSVTWGLVAILGALAATVLAVAALPALIAAVITAIFSLLTGIITLMFRKVLIIMCLIFSPLALLMWLLPGTQSYYKLWKDNFIKALMMFPLVVAMVAAGRIFAYITGTQDTGVASVALNFIFIMVGYFAPLFILPKTFKWGGSLMSTVGGTIQSTLKPASEGLSKFGREYGDRWQGSKANQYDPNIGGFKGWRGRTLRRVQSGHILPTARDRKLAIQKGDQWSHEEDEIGAAYANRAYGRALETGYQDRESDGSLKFEAEKDEQGNDRRDTNGNKIYRRDAQGNLIPVMLTGTAAAKQALVDLAHHEDKKIAKGAIGRLIKTASWPEIQSSVDAKGRRVYEDNSNWGNTVSKDETLYPSVLKSRVDTAPHIVYSAEKRVAAGEAKMREEMADWGLSEADQQSILAEGATNNYRRFKAIYQMRYALHDQMSPEDFASQSEGFWDEAAKLANGAGGSVISAELKDRLDDIAKTGTSGQQIFGHMAGGTLQPKVDSVLSGGRDTKEGWKPNQPGALNTYIDRAVGVTSGNRPSSDAGTPTTPASPSEGDLSEGGEVDLH